MIVKELIELLQKQDPAAAVLVSTTDTEAHVINVKRADDDPSIIIIVCY